MIPTALFDLDGTLVDSVPDLHAALNRLMQQRGFPAFALAEVLPMVGDGATVLVQRAFAARGAAADSDAVAAFLHDYEANAAVATRPFDGIVAALDALTASGWRLAVCTNKPGVATAAVLQALGLAERFAAVGAGDSFPVRKPDPAHLLGTLALAGGRADRAVMIGDHRNDVAAAAAAGIPCVFAAWGYGAPAMGTTAAATARKPAELTALLPALLGLTPGPTAP